MSRILCIGDLHIPCVRKGYLEFCKYLKRHYHTNTTVFLGDVVDEHAVSPSHIALPDAPGAREEISETRELVREWYGAFRNAKVAIGNHDERPYRAAAMVHIGEDRLRSLSDMWGTPHWDWKYDHIIEGILFVHRTNNSGQCPAFNAMRQRAMSCVLGHHHSVAGVRYLVNPERRLFGLDVGAGCDDRAIQFRYFRAAQARSVMSAAVILDGFPQVHIMPCGESEPFHDSNFS